MSPIEPEPPFADVLTVAADLGLIPTENLDSLRRDCRGSGQSPTQFLAARGLLTPVDVDIVETLTAPLDAIPGYRVLGMIGRGGMGVVYRAEQRNLGRTVALKTILVNRMSDRAALERFELEARTIGQLRHPNIITAHDYGRHGGRVFLAMELVEGTDLDRRIKENGPLEEFIAWGLMRQTVAGLAHAREHHVVHRDIKPANLILVPPPAGYPLPAGMPMVKIADFGLALLQEDVAADTRLTAPDATVGSPHYMAPEQLETSDVDFRADMYALGATMFHALAGRPPFAGMKLPQLIGAKLGDGPPRLEHLVPGLAPETCRLVHALLERQPEDRPADYHVLLRQIDDVMARLSVTSQTQSLQTAGTVIGPELRSGPASGAVIGDEADVTDALVGVQTLVGKARPVAVPAPRPVPVRRWWPAVVGLGLLGVIAFAAGRGLWFARDPVTNTPGPVPPVQQIGHVVPLFNGVNTGGWRIEFGNWVPIPGEAVLQGTDGVVSRRLPRRRDLGLDEEAGDGPPLWYCLELLMQPGESSGGDGTEAAGELHFGLTRESVPDSSRYVLRRSGATLVLGSRRGDKAPFERDERIPPRPLAMSDDAAVELQRLPVGWFVTINGEHYAALPLESSPLPEFRLLAEGTARFSDLYLHAVQQAETAR